MMAGHNGSGREAAAFRDLRAARIREKRIRALRKETR
jgi:hypothetical protein